MGSRSSKINTKYRFAETDTVTSVEVPAIEQIVKLCHETARQMIEDPVVGAGIRLTLDLSAANGRADPYVGWFEGCRVLIERAQREGEQWSFFSPPVSRERSLRLSPVSRWFRMCCRAVQISKSRSTHSADAFCRALCRLPLWSDRRYLSGTFTCLRVVVGSIDVMVH